jgi:hypothetical protein
VNSKTEIRQFVISREYPCLFWRSEFDGARNSGFRMGRLGIILNRGSYKPSFSERNSLGCRMFRLGDLFLTVRWSLG